MDGEIATIYVSQNDVSGTDIVPGWYFEHDYTDIPQGPYESLEAAELAGNKDYNHQLAMS